jgi:hypothetical protein
MTIINAARTIIATAALLLAPAVCHATPPTTIADAARAPGASCARATYIRPSDGAIVTRVVCALPAPAPRGAK